MDVADLIVVSAFCWLALMFGVGVACDVRAWSRREWPPGR